MNTTTAQQAGEQPKTHTVYKATCRSTGESCHFGEASTARAWIGGRGDVEAISVQSRPELCVVAAPHAPQSEPLTEADIDSVYRDVWSTVPHAKRLDEFAHRIYALAARASAGSSRGAAKAPIPRFFIDHDCIHDRLTGKHIHGDRDVEPGTADESVAMLNDLAERATKRGADHG